MLFKAILKAPWNHLVEYSFNHFKLFFIKVVSQVRYCKVSAMCLKLTADWSVSLLAMIRSWPLFTVNLIFLIIKVTSQVSVLQSLGNVAEADCWMVSKFTGYGQGPVSKCISCDQVLGRCLLQGIWTCRQLKKNMPPLRLKTEVFMAQMEQMQQMWWKPQRKQYK